MPRVQLLHRWLLAQSPHQQCRDHGELQLMESLHVGPMAWLWYLTQYTYSAPVPSLQHPTCDAHAVCSCPTKLHHITNPETPYYASVSIIMLSPHPGCWGRLTLLPFVPYRLSPTKQQNSHTRQTHQWPQAALTAIWPALQHPCQQRLPHCHPTLQQPPIRMRLTQHQHQHRCQSRAGRRAKGECLGCCSRC
jgi:hypothetical protein